MNKKDKQIEEMKELIKRKHRSRHISTDPNIKKQFGSFQVPKLLKPEDDKHFKDLYNYDNLRSDIYSLPDEKREKALKEQKQKEKEKLAKERRESNLKPREEESIEIIDQLQNDEDNTEDQNIRLLKETFLRIFDKEIQKQEAKELEVELYLQPNSKIAEVFAKTKTGEQAVQFFAMYGVTTPIKFIFCEKRDPVKFYDFEPYELKTIQDQRIETIRCYKDFFIVTPTGITHIYKPVLKSEEPEKKEEANKVEEVEMDPEKKKKLEERKKNEEKKLLANDKSAKQVAEFYTLSDWMYQSTQFKVLRKINYYKNYLPFKLFIIWRNYNKYVKFIRIRNSLGSKLFLTKPAFVNSFINCNSEVLSMEKIKLHDIARQLWSQKGLSDFDDEMKKTIDKAKGSLKSLLEGNIFKRVRTLYKIIYSHLKENKEIDDKENAKTLQELKNKSMYILKLEKEMRSKLIKMAIHDIEL